MNGMKMTNDTEHRVGYQFSELWGVRGSLGGLWARNRYAFPKAEYHLKFIQPAVDLHLNLTSLLLGRLPEGRTHAYAFLGAGAAYSWDNGEAVTASTATSSSSR